MFTMMPSGHAPSSLARSGCPQADAEPDHALHRFASMQQVDPSKFFNWFLVKNRLMLTLLRFEGG
ncbi:MULTISPECIES: hypothetical protein [unclassified Burkholderia]|uniref:hypothetical protein n=1 Tax=unclassified Burkholderia TaxID=2613784 RepID=UPI000F5A0936|nr:MULTISPECIES: hypothetical protein [unclassified Burkholderia]TGN93986.1 hypothetical protein PL79_030050 [Burkholderia sp. USMB20]